MIPRRAIRLIAIILVACGFVLIASAAYIPAKAALAQALLERAWARTEAGETDVRSWPWADITPLAVIEVPRLHQRVIVLEGASGQAMAFGPGHMSNTPAIGTHGTTVIAAHRDTQFAFLGELQNGDRIETTLPDGSRRAFRVTQARVVRADASGLDPADGGINGSRVALVTCYPFSGVLHSPLRYVVLAERDDKGV